MKNSLKLAILAFFCFFFTNILAQENIENDSKISKKNVLRLDILFPSLTYDRLIWQKEKHKMGLLAGFMLSKGYVPEGVDDSRWQNYYANLGAYYLYGKKIDIWK